MSRSLRNHPFLANSSHESEKTDKQRAHQRERKWFNDHLHPTDATIEDFDIINFHEHPKSGRALFAKNGKAFHGGEMAALRK
jgi:hypothetical protein